MARLNKTQKYAIQWLNSSGKTIEEISSELDIPVKQVGSVLEKNSNAGNEDKIPVATSKVGSIPNLMINETASKRNKGVAIMTREASEVHDAARSKLVGQKKNMEGIFRPKG